MKYNFKIIPNEHTPETPPITDIDGYLAKNIQTVRAFLDFAKHQFNGVGLAANQCELNGKRYNERLFAWKNLQTNEWSIVIDPVIVDTEGLPIIREEGCLTWLGKKLFAERYRAIDVICYDIRGKKQSYYITWSEAQIFQHEINHLNGVKENIVELNERLPKQNKVLRNDLCPCGSGKKYKKCCI
jgi:peptide deformylase